jgi:alpha-glucosidase
MRQLVRGSFVAACLATLPALANPGRAGEVTQVLSPNGGVQFTLLRDAGRLQCALALNGKPVLQPSPLRFTLDGVDLADGVEVGEAAAYQVDETYPWYGAHAQAHNHCRGAKLPIRHLRTDTRYVLEVRVFDDGAAFRWIVPGGAKPRVPDEASTFVLPVGCTVWYHDLEGHYEGVHVQKNVDDVPTDQWVAPPMTYQLPGGAGYASITEAALVGYAGMAFQAEGERGFGVRLGHRHPPSYPFRLRYGQAEAQRLAQPAALTGTVTTPWRVVLVGPDLNALVNADVVWDLCPPPDPKLFPEGLHTAWIKPGRAVWKYLDSGQSTLAEMKEFCRLAHELGFEHHIIEGFWARWSDAEIKELVEYAKQQHVSLWVWKHSRDLHDPQARHDFLQRCHDLGIAGVKIDFFDHEAREIIDLYQAILREAAELHLLVDFHGANKPTGENRTWPNELTREAVKGMEASKLADRATHDVTLPFTRLLAGPAEYTPLHFGPRRGNTSWAHQAASAAILGGPLQTYAAHPANILANPCGELVRTVPSTWDETRVLPPSAIGQVAVFARRSGSTWFLAIMNGASPRQVSVPLGFLGEGVYRARLLRDDPDDSAMVHQESKPLRDSDVLAIELRAGGGFLGRFTRD